MTTTAQATETYSDIELDAMNVRESLRRFEEDGRQGGAGLRLASNVHALLESLAPLLAKPPAPEPPDARLAEIRARLLDRVATMRKLCEVRKPKYYARDSYAEMSRKAALDTVRELLLPVAQEIETLTTDLLARVEADAATIAALRKDAERLDWLATASGCIYGGPRRGFPNAITRENIDAAMRAGTGRP